MSKKNFLGKYEGTRYYYEKDINGLIAYFKEDKQITKYGYSIKGVLDDGVIRTKKESGYGLLDLDGNEICEFEFMSVGKFHHGIAKVCSKDELFGAINTKGIIKYPCGYDKVEVTDKWIDTTVKCSIPIAKLKDLSYGTMLDLKFL